MQENENAKAGWERGPNYIHGFGISWYNILVQMSDFLCFLRKAVDVKSLSRIHTLVLFGDGL